MPDSFIIENSEKILCDEEVITEGLYTIDYLHGIIDLIGELNCDSVTISYQYADIAVDLQKQNRKPSGTGGQLIANIPRNYMGMIPEENRLVHTGSLLRGVKIGSRSDASIESAFQLEAYGAIGENVEITAIMSDQNLPIQPEGTSEKLTQLEQVVISVKGPFFGATFGDFNVEFPKSEFSEYSRRLSGVTLNAFSENASIQAVGAVLEGVWASMEFNCIEGNQGPYQIKASGTNAVQILAGTETVWLNGNRLRRGDNNDYTIDYNLGQITFSTNRPVGSKDRVVIDFQYTDIQFRRSFYGASGELSPFERITLRYSAMIESDDPNNPLLMDFNDTEIEALESAGDISDSAYIITAFISDSGEYVLIDTIGDSNYFEWVGIEDGEWHVDFRFVGNGKGDYEYVSPGRYEFVGAGDGSYRPTKLLPLPASQSVLNVGTQYEISDDVTIYGELATSAFDKNRLSSIQDDDNVDVAWATKITFTQDVNLFGIKLGGISLNGQLRHKGRNYASIGRQEDAEFIRDWGFDSRSGEENLAEATITYKPSKSLAISSSYGSNEINNIINKRISSNMLFKTEGMIASANYLRIQSNRLWEKYWGELSGKIWLLRPEIKARYEDRDSIGGFRFYELNNTLPWVINNNFTISPGFDIRQDEHRDSSGISPESRIKTLRLTSQMHNWKLTLNHRFSEDLTGEGADLMSILGRVEGSISLKVPKTDLHLRYELSNRQSEVVQPVYEYVGQGAGNFEFDQDRGEYIPLAGGDYLRRFLPTGDFTPTVGSDLKTNFSLDMANLESKKRAFQFFKLISLDGLIRAESNSLRDSPQAFLLNPSNIFERTDLSFGRFNAEGNFRIGARKPRGLILRRKTMKSRNAQFTTGEEIRHSGEWSVEGRMNTQRTGSFIATAKLYTTARIYPSNPHIGADISGEELNLSWNKMIDNNLQLSVATSYLDETDRHPEEPVQIRRFALMPGLGYFFTTGNIRADVQFSRVSALGDFRGILPYEMAQGDFIGNNGKILLIANIAVASSATLTLNYELISRTERKPEHSASASVRLVF